MATRTNNSRPSEAIQNYAKAIYALEQRGDGAVTTNALAERLHVTPASASSMVRKLDELGFVTHVPYKGVKLTEGGRRVALEVLRHHRLLELYLAESLGVPWDRVHDEAEVLEHVLSDRMLAAIDARLGFPTADPHGDPIPSAELSVPVMSGVLASTLADGQRGRVVRISDRDAAVLREVTAAGIGLGSTIAAGELAAPTAAHIWVQPIS